MKKTHIISSMILVVALLTPRTTRAQGTTTYMSNVSQTSAGSRPVGSDSWLAAMFETGPSGGGYLLDSIQLGMADAAGNPSGFTAMLYSGTGGAGPFPGSSLGTLTGSLNPTTAGIYLYTPDSILTLSPSTPYAIVLTAGTPVANGPFEWSVAGANSYNPSGGWFSLGGLWTSSDGSTRSWNITEAFPQFAITASPIPEPGTLSLLALAALAFFWHRRKANAAER